MFDQTKVKEIKLFSTSFEDIQKARVAVENRAYALEQSGQSNDMEAILAGLLENEHAMSLALKRNFRKCSPALREWQKRSPGIGEHLIGRLIGEIGNPAISVRHHWEGAGSTRKLVEDGLQPRTIGQLWSYCGHGDPERKLRKGITDVELYALGNPKAKMLTYLNAQSCVMQRSGTIYRQVYENARETYSDRVHAKECRRCGPSGKPAAVGSPWSLGHQQAAAIRKVGKEILRDMWIVCNEELTV